jgi:hypothetical protein
MGLKHHRPKAQAPLEIQLLDFLYGEWGDKSPLHGYLINVPSGEIHLLPLKSGSGLLSFGSGSLSANTRPSCSDSAWIS